ncbi:MAG: DapH/DapD/GlmU-related protein [Candidatus Saccharimonas sp.]
MTRKKVVKPGYKLVKITGGYLVEVPEDLEVGEELTLSWHGTLFAGKNCKLGNNVRLDYVDKLGDNVAIGDETSISGSKIGSNVTVGAGCTIQASELRDVTIGDNVVIKTGVQIQPGVAIPDNWHITSGCVVNPGIDGAPVVIPPKPECRCSFQRVLQSAEGGHYH